MHCSDTYIALKSDDANESTLRCVKMAVYNIVFTTDIHYLPYTFVACQSVIDAIEKNKDDSSANEDKIIFNVLVDESVNLPEVEERAKAFSKRTSPIINNEFNFKLVNASLFKGYEAWSDNKSYGIYYRLLIDKIFPESIETLLYLDVDVLVLDDIRKLFKETDLSGKVFGVTLDLYTEEKQLYDSKKLFGKPLELSLKDYYFSGLLLVNMREWRKHNVGEQCLSLANQYKFSTPDQDLLNIFVRDFLVLDCCWHFVDFYYCLKYSKETDSYDTLKSSNDNDEMKLFSGAIDAQEYEKAVVAPKIIHYANIKPWAFEKSKAPLSTRLLMDSRYLISLNLWYQTAKRVPEFAYALDKFDEVDSTTAFAQAQKYMAISVAKKTEVSLNARRRKDRKNLLYMIVALFIVELITLFIALD